MGRQPLVAYLQGDESAREIAERMVALASIPLTVAPLAPETFTASLAGGEAALYIFTLPRTFPGSCGRIPAWPSGSAVVPLVDVRAHAVVRSGVPPFTTNDDGTFQFDLPVTLVPLPGPMR
jgi:hypothetical protein